MNKEDLLSVEFLKQFKIGVELHSFLAKLQKRSIEKMLEGALDEHFGYKKHIKTDGSNTRNQFSIKKIKTSYIECEIQVPRDRDASFNPMLHKWTTRENG